MQKSPAGPVDRAGLSVRLGGGAELDDAGRVDGLSAEAEGDPHCFGVGAEVEVIRHCEGDRAYGCDQVTLVHDDEGAGRGLGTGQNGDAEHVAALGLAGRCAEQRRVRAGRGLELGERGPRVRRGDDVRGVAAVGLDQGEGVHQGVEVAAQRAAVGGAGEVEQPGGAGAGWTGTRCWP